MTVITSYSIHYTKLYDTYQKLFRQKPQLTFEERIDTVISWLRMPEEARPQLVMLYFEEPDGTGHHFGPRSLETKRKVEYLDSLVGVLMHKISRLPIADRINLIVTSDHGMTEISDERVVNMHQYLKPEWCRVIRITSYNVCYTKLLRNPVTAAIMQFGGYFFLFPHMNVRHIF